MMRALFLARYRVRMRILNRAISPGDKALFMSMFPAPFSLLLDLLGPF
jgi:hypothetical protein